MGVERARARQRAKQSETPPLAFHARHLRGCVTSIRSTRTPATANAEPKASANTLHRERKGRNAPPPTHRVGKFYQSQSTTSSPGTASPHPRPLHLFTTLYRSSYCCCCCCCCFGCCCCCCCCRVHTCTSLHRVGLLCKKNSSKRGLHCSQKSRATEKAKFVEL